MLDLMATPTLERPWLRWYGLQRWRNRAKWQLKQHPLCVMCLEKNIVMAANAADHIEPHRGDQKKFWFGKLQSLCPEHHASSKQQLENKGFVNDIGLDGFPVDENHPFHRRP